MRTLALMCFLLVAVPFNFADEPIVVKGVVLRNDGKPLEGAFVLIRDYRLPGAGNVSDKWESRTAADGSFSFTAPRGCYDIFVSANSQFLPLAERLCVEPELRALRIKLQPDPHPVQLQD